jgi:hypothetical protein
VTNKNAVAMAQGFIHDGLDPHIVLDWLMEHAPSHLARRFDKAAATAWKPA